MSIERFKSSIAGLRDRYKDSPEYVNRIMVRARYCLKRNGVPDEVIKQLTEDIVASDRVETKFGRDKLCLGAGFYFWVG